MFLHALKKAAWNVTAWFDFFKDITATILFLI
jgi:hypothetical protein